MKAPILLSPARLTLLALFRKVMHALMGSSSRKLILLPLLLLTSLPTPVKPAMPPLASLSNLST
ncbi:hypothetical protein [Rubritalea tangerina]|uniref:hypothetical protein n=1 Tax=Rubritalea tangerina TaxID=430798 RepID=UPI0036176AEE